MKIAARPLFITFGGNQAAAVDCHDPRLKELIDDPRIVFIGVNIALIVDPDLANAACEIVTEMYQPERPTNRRVISQERVEVVCDGLEPTTFDSETTDFSTLLEFVGEVRADQLTLHVPDEDRFAEWLGRMYFRPYRPEPTPPEPEVLTPKQIENLGKRWDRFILTDRTLNALEKLGHTHIWQTAEKTEVELIKDKVSRKAIHELQDALSELGLHLGTIVPEEVKAATAG